MRLGCNLNGVGPGKWRPFVPTDIGGDREGQNDPDHEDQFSANEGSHGSSPSTAQMEKECSQDKPGSAGDAEKTRFGNANTRTSFVDDLSAL
jgi:hypothetical protein